MAHATLTVDEVEQISGGGHYPMGSDSMSKCVHHGSGEIQCEPGDCAYGP